MSICSLAGRTDGTADMKDLLGGKGANLAEMASLGLPVPPGFTITTEVCTAYYADGRKLPDGLKAEVEAALAEVGKAVGASFGDVKSPLLVSVRSGARASMPGMMDTILNLGLNDETVKGLAAKSGSERFAYDSYRRFIQMYSNVVLDVDHGVFEDILENHKNLNGHSLDTDLAADDWREVIDAYKEAIERETGKPFPQSTSRAAVGRDRRRVRLLAERSAPTPTAACMPSPTAGAPPSTCRPWCSATSATPRPPASPSRAIPRPARARSTASSWSTRRARTWWPASARRSRSRRPHARPPARSCRRSKR